MTNAEPFDYPAHVTAPDNYAWRDRDRRRPTVPTGEHILFDEPGRLLPSERPGGGHVCCRSHHFIVTQGAYGRPMLRVHHGGGERAWPLGWDNRVVEGLQRLTSDERFRLFWTLVEAHEDSYARGAGKAANEYEAAFLEGRLRKRKRKGTNTYRVDILPPGDPRLAQRSVRRGVQA